MKKIPMFAAGLPLLAFLSGPAAAHHSFAMFDMDRKVTIQGTIAEIQWTNPHVWIELEVPGEDGGLERWGVEFTSRVHLTRRGFPRDKINVGDKATFTISPYVNGDPGGRFYTLETDKGVIYRDPGAQREFEQRQAAASQ